MENKKTCFFIKKQGDYIKSNKILIVLIILLAGCILVSSSTAADIDVQSIDSDSYVSSIEQNSLNDLNDSNVEPGTKNTGNDKSVTNLKAKTANDNTDKDISKLGVTYSFTDLNNLIQDDTTGTLTLSADDIYKYSSSDSAFKNGITISKSIVIDGNGCTIDGSGSARAFVIDGKDVILKNINFINCNHTVDGGAIFWNANNGAVINCTFTNIIASNYGGAIFWNDNMGTVRDCTFINTTSSYGAGAVYWASGANGNVSDCTFIKTSASQGGAIFWDVGANGVVSDCTFINTTASQGGAIFWNSGANGTVSDCTFINTTASGDGGAIYWNSTNGTVTDCTFSNANASRYGGAVYWNSVAINGAVSDCTFTNTTASGDGGAIRWYGKDGVVSNCTFNNTNSSHSGGAVFWNGVNGTVTGCTFTNTNSSYTGGAVSCNGANGTVKDCTFSNTNSSYGGAVYWCSCANGTLSNCTFNNTITTNESSGRGGAIYFDYADNCSVSGCTFSNTNSSYGGVIFWAGANGVVSDCTFSNTSASNYGGAIYYTVLGTNGVVSDCTFSNTSALAGGAVYWNSGVNGTVTGCTFSNSNASRYGGAIAWYAGAVNGTVSNCTFTNCSTNTNGGAISWADVNGSVSDCTFTNCSASEDGGAVYWSGANGAVSDCTFSNTSSSSGYGGAIFWSGANGTVNCSDFVNCSANKNGPAVYIASSGSLNISDSTCTPIDNRAPIYNDGTILSPVVITTMDGKTKTVAYGKVVNVTGNITTSDMRVAGGVLNLTVNGTSLNATSDEYGLYSVEYTVDFNGTKPVTATYYNSTKELQSLIEGKLRSLELILVNVSDVSGVYGDNITGSINTTLNGNITFTIDGKDFTGSVIDGAFVITNVTGLNAGNYTDVPVSFISEDGCYGGDTTVNFTFSSKPVDITVNVPDYTYGAGINGTMNYTGHEGNVTITINGVDYNGTFNSEGNFIISDVLPVKEYTGTFSFITNDGNYIGSAPVSFNVTNANGSFKVSVADSVYGSGFTINVTDAIGVNDEQLNGTVVVTINNKDYTVTIKDGKGFNTTTDVLPVGEYSVSASLTVPNYNKIENSTKFNVTKFSPDVSITTDDIDYGDDLSVNVTVTGLESDVPSGNVTILVNGTEYANKTLTDGECEFIIPDLGAGDYNITVVYNGNDNYNSSNSSANITVSPVPAQGIDIIVNTPEYGTEGVVNVTVIGLDGKAVPTGNVTILVNGTEYDTVSLSDGNCSYTIPTILVAGDYNVTVVYNGDINYTSIENSADLTVIPKYIDMSTVIYNATYGDDTISGVVNASMNGTVYVSIVPGSTKPITADVNESGEFTIPLKLPAGTYSNVAVTFLSADGNYRGSTRVNITINQADPQVLVDIGSEESFDIKFGDTVVSIVSVPEDATGVVYFSLDNETWIPVNIPEGKNSVEFDIPDLDAGDYILFVRYSGDNNYNSVYSENPFSVDQLNTVVTVDPVKGKAGEKVKITARVTDERGNPVQEGTIIIKVNGKEYKANVVNGIATVEVTLPNKAGTYSITAYYEGFNYNTSSTTFTVDVSDIPNPNPTPVNNGVGNMENTGNPLLVLIIALCAIGLESFRRKF